ncbi:MAG: alpha/beta hydrolase [Rivularia sp. (in: Bacteria)]|nr:alpha/beta hydrolase [Rivularia sp. MS3]
MQRLEAIKVRIKTRKRIYKFIIITFIILNILSYGGAYYLTYFNSYNRQVSSKKPADIGLKYETKRISINRNEWLDTWFIPAENKSNGTVLLFPGNNGSKAKQLLAPTQVFHDLDYNTLLVDFRGLGASSGNSTTIGFREAEDVALAVNYAEKSKLKHPYILYGVSMGSAAILKSMADKDKNINPEAIILEAPFARLVNAVGSRLKAIKIPTFPITQLIVFWGGIQHGFNGFTHNPVTYAKSVKCPTLILQGKLDKWTSLEEINEILQNLQGSKELVIFPDAGHNLLVTVDKQLWKQSVEKFLGGI